MSLKVATERPGILERGPAAVLRMAGFRRLWTAGLLSDAGTQINRIALVLALAQSSHAIGAVAYLVLCETLPGSLAAAVSGAAVDRYDRRKIMIATDLLRAALLGVAALFPVAAVLYVIVALESVATAFFSPARSALIPALAPTHALSNANSMDQASSTFVMIGGPVLGAQLFFAFGLRTTLVIDAVSFLVSAALIFGIRAGRSAPAHNIAVESPLAAIRAGWRYLSGHTLARHLLTMSGVSLLCVGLWTPVAPVFIREFLHSSGRVLGLQLSLFGIGGLCGSLLAPALAARYGKGLLVTMALFGEAAAMLVYSLVPQPQVSAIVIFLWGTIVSAMVVPSNALLQEHVHGDFLGRVFALSRQLESSATVLAVLAAAMLQRVLPASGIFLVAATGYLLLTAVSLNTRGGKTLLRAT